MLRGLIFQSLVTKLSDVCQCRVELSICANLNPERLSRSQRPQRDPQRIFESALVWRAVELWHLAFIDFCGVHSLQSTAAHSSDYV